MSAMRIVIAGSGSLGDTRPYLALAAGLDARGHDTVVCLDACGRDTAAELGLEFHELPGDFRRHLDGGHGQRALDRSDSGLEGLRLFRSVAREYSGEWVHTIRDVARSHRADTVIGSGLATWAAISAAESVGARAVGAAAFPLTETAYFPSPVAPRRPPAFLNRATHRVGVEAVWRMFRGPTDRARRPLGLPPLRLDWSRLPVVYGFSEHLVPRPPDWPDTVAVCGDWHLPEPDWQMPGPLAEFLARHDRRPAYVGFGSMSTSGAAHLVRTLLTAFEDHPVLLAPGWSGVMRGLGPLPDSVHVVGTVPHARVLPLCALAVHHCGAGTTHAVARAGIPSIPVPFAADQPFWARRLARLGIGTAPLDRRRLVVADARRAIDLAGSTAMTERARHVAASMATEDPVGGVIRHLS